MLKILEELSTFTFRQTTRWVDLTNNKSTNICQFTIPHSTKVYLFCVRNNYSKHILGQRWDAIHPILIQPLASKNVFTQCVTFWPLFPLFCRYLVLPGRELGWAVCLFFYDLGISMFRPSMGLNQRQVSLVVSDWESYLGSLGFTVGGCLFPCECLGHTVLFRFCIFHVYYFVPVFSCGFE